MKKTIYFTILCFFVGMAFNAFSSDDMTQVATEKAYFDVITGHKYIQNQDGSYTEYAKKGKIFRTNVSNTQPHLATSRYIVVMEPNSYIIYKKSINQEPVTQILSVSDDHPEGWSCQELLTTAKREPRTMDIGLGYTEAKAEDK